MNKLIIQYPTEENIDPIDHSLFFKDLNFYHIKELELLSSLVSALTELHYSYKSYELQLKSVTEITISEIDKVINQINESQIAPSQNILIILRKTEMKYHFNNFLIISKSVLDKLVPFFDYRFHSNLTNFKSSGKNIMNHLRKAIKTKQDFENHIHSNLEWISCLIDLRDKYTHSSELHEYIDFSIIKSSSSKPILDINDFNQPCILINGEAINALSYLEESYNKLAAFINGFLKFCDYETFQKPPIISKCKCGLKFGNLNKEKTIVYMDKYNPFDVLIADEDLKLGTIVCKKCFLKYSTDLNFWRKVKVVMS